MSNTYVFFFLQVTTEDENMYVKKISSNITMKNISLTKSWKTEKTWTHLDRTDLLQLSGCLDCANLRIEHQEKILKNKSM
jgi:hypothetical protein